MLLSESVPKNDEKCCTGEGYDRIQGEFEEEDKHIEDEVALNMRTGK